MFSTHSRRDHIHGLMIGVAIGEALGLPLRGYCPKSITARIRRSPLRYRLFPGTGLTGAHTSLLLLTAQSVACSASDSKTFVDVYQDRLKWYLFSFPFGLDAASFKAGMKGWLKLFKVPTGSQSLGNAPATRSLFLALALHGTGSRLKRWVDLSTSITHTHPLTVDGCQVLAGLADLTINQLNQFDALDASSKISALSSQAEIRDRLVQFPEFLKEGRRPRFVAKQFGWEAGIESHIVPTSVMAAYCYLRYPNDFNQAVRSAIRLGGDTAAMGAIVGGLCGVNLGIKRLPENLVSRLSDVAYGPTWMKGMAIRMSHWPHGPDDLHSAHAEPTAVVELTVMNFFRAVLTAINNAQRVPSLLGFGNNTKGRAQA